MMKKATAVILAAAMAAALTACGGGEKAETTAADTKAETTAAKEDAKGAESPAEETKAGEEAAAGGTILMATNAEFEPWEFHDGDAIVGIDPEIAGAIAEKLGMELKVEDMAFDAIIPSVASGKCDFAMAGMTVNPERAASVDFTDTYASSSLVILVKADNTEITGEDTLAGHVVGAQLGTTGDTTASDICGDDKVERYNTFFEAVQSLKQGKIDAVTFRQGSGQRIPFPE